MTATPQFLTGDVAEPTKLATLNYQGGSLTASRGLMAAIFESANFLSSCAFVETERTRKSYTRTEFIGDTPRVVAQTQYTEKKYPSQTKSQAAGGEAIFIRVDGEWWTARLSGSHSEFMTFLCDSRDDLTGPIAWRSERGTTYGPLAPSSSGKN